MFTINDESFFWFIGGVVVAILICYILSSVERMIHELRCTHTPKKSNCTPYVSLPSGEVPSTVTLKGKYGEVSVSSVFCVPTEQALRVYLGLVKTETGGNICCIGIEFTPKKNSKKNSRNIKKASAPA